MNQLLALVRIATVLAVLFLGVVVVLFASIIPLRFEGRRLAAWVSVGLARTFCLLFNVRVNCHTCDQHNCEQIIRHRGFLFANHQSYLDSIALLSIMPVRFLAAAEVRSYPLVGWIAKAIGTIFVKREDRSSRHQVRTAIADAFRSEPDPPVVLFPEGKLGHSDQLLPFRHGAFEMATAHQLPYLLCAIRYTPSEIAIWRGGAGETLATAVWRLAQYPGPLQVEILPCARVQATTTSRPTDLVESAQQIIATVLRGSACDCQLEVIKT
jgi:1-acyl-sn-glycerol-3-phosphate acyltransferase